MSLNLKFKKFRFFCPNCKHNLNDTLIERVKGYIGIKLDENDGEMLSQSTEIEETINYECTSCGQEIEIDWDRDFPIAPRLPCCYNCGDGSTYLTRFTRDSGEREWYCRYCRG